MFQTDQATAVSSLPTPAAAGTQGFFTAGNPAAGQAATILDADWLNMIQQELINVVVAAGLTPSKTTYTQVRDAVAQMYGPGRFLGVQTFTSSGTYTPGTYTVGGRSVTATKARVRGIGGGGAGGSVTFTTSTQAAIAGGGNSGAYGEILITSGLTSQAVTIGAGGAPGAQGNNPGGTGGNTSFGSLLVAAGGIGGYGGAGNTPPFAVYANGTAAACSGSGNFIVAGRGAIASTGSAFSVTNVGGGNGAASLWGGGGLGAGGGAGTAAVGYGAGGGGAGQGAGAGAGASGGAGAPGYLIVEEYA